MRASPIQLLALMSYLSLGAERDAGLVVVPFAPEPDPDPVDLPTEITPDDVKRVRDAHRGSK